MEKQFADFLQAKFNIKKGVFNGFIDKGFEFMLKAIKENNIRLSLSEQSDLFNFFNSHRESLSSIQSQADQTDREIDRMVYALYGLTEEEIRIVESA